MGTIKFTTAEVEQILDGRMNSFRQDIVDSLHTVGSPQNLLAATEYRITNDALTRNSVVSPTYITDRWDATNNKIDLLNNSPINIEESVLLNPINTIISDIGKTYIEWHMGLLGSTTLSRIIPGPLYIKKWTTNILTANLY